MNMTRKTIIEDLKDVIENSGQEFASISKQSIFNFLKNQGISSESWESVYNTLSDYYKPKKSKDRQHASSVVDYTDNSHNDVKVRQPRKTIFSEIKKIAG